MLSYGVYRSALELTQAFLQSLYALCLRQRDFACVWRSTAEHISVTAGYLLEVVRANLSICGIAMETSHASVGRLLAWVKELAISLANVWKLYQFPREKGGSTQEWPDVRLRTQSIPIESCLGLLPSRLFHALLPHSTR